MKRVFPPWTNHLRPLSAAAVGGGVFYAALVVTFGFSPWAVDVGYQPEQPVPYSHTLHVGQLGLDCRYCHNTVDRAKFAAIPATETCMACHARIRDESPKLTPIRESWATGQPVPWVKVHDLPDYAYFDHSAHVTKGVPCVACHGRIDQMDVVHQAQPLSMGWCLSCHRDPAPNLRPVDLVTKMDWSDTPMSSAQSAGVASVKPSTDCSTCHR
ncbi:MAG: cytochrome c3 family protein [Deltaproteobacteria bacterium]|nr:cytochrome c3 family protein [Deltaproteobacteria bacterium]